MTMDNKLSNKFPNRTLPEGSTFRIAALAMLTPLLLVPSLASASVILAHANTSALSQGLIGYWPMDGNTTNWTTDTTQDLSGQGNTGLLVSMSTTTSPTSGKIGGALKFNGTNQLIETTTNNGSASTLTTITLSAWFKTTSASGDEIISLNGSQDGSSAVSDRGIYIGTNGKVYGYIYDTSAKYVTSTNTYTDGKWHLATLSIKSGSTMALSIDGIAQPSAAIGTPYTGYATSYWVIGRDNNAGQTNAGAGYFPGTIDDVRIYSRALSPQEVSLLYAVGEINLGNTPALTSSPALLTSGLNAGLVGYWPMDGNTTNWKTDTTADQSGTGNIGMLINMSTSTSPAAGKIGETLKFNGTNQYISISNSTSINLSSTVTISAWVYPKVFSFLAGIVSKYNASSGNEYFLRMSASSPYNKLDCGGATDFTSTGTLSLNKWQYVTCVVAGGTANIYINGALDSSGTATISSGTDPITIGSDFLPSQRLWNGSIDDVRIYNRALSAQEISQLYAQGAANIGHSSTPLNSSFSILNSGLVGYWTFDGPSMNWTANTAADSSGGGYTGTLNNFSKTTSPVAGKIGQAMKFNGTNQYVSHSSISAYNFGTGDFSVSFWMKPVSPWGSATTEGLIGQKTSDSFNGWQIYQDSGQPGKLNMRLTQQNNFLTTSTIPTGKWTYATFARKSGTTYWYLNGIQDSTGTNTSNISDTGSFYIGYAQTWSAYYSGSLDDVRIYNRALSPQEVQQLYLTGK
jgi:hypothetical protein